MRFAGQLLVFGVVALGGCRWLGSAPTCEAPEQVLATAAGQALTCDDLEAMVGLVESIAARELGSGDRRQLAQGLQQRFGEDPGATRAQLDAARATRSELGALRGLEAAERRSTLAYETVTGDGVLGAPDDAITEVAKRALAVWARSDAERLALTEIDIEGWIHYASLCREVQKGGALRLSVADRVGLYRDLEELFLGLDRRGMVAMGAVGPFWPSVRLRWAVASYEDQQAWASAAPLPPPMLSTSKGYLSAILAGDVRLHAAALHDSLGPLRLDVVR